MMRGALLLAVVLPLVGARGVAQSGYQSITVADGGIIRGVVKWSGPVPKTVALPINKDIDVCDPNSQKKRDLERLVISPNGGVANTVVYLNDITKGKALELPEARQFLDQKSCRYEPHILLVPQNGTLKLKSSDNVLHTVHMSGAADYNLPFPFANQVVSRTMNREGLVELRCNAGHVWMSAEIFVVPHPYYTVTDSEGNFELSDVPPGDYEVVAWHEGWKVVGQAALYDVMTQAQVRRPTFSQPMTWSKNVSVSTRGTTEVKFSISDKGADLASSR